MTKPTAPAPDWSRPVEMSDAEFAFPALILGKFIPRYETLPEEYRRERTIGCQIASGLFALGGSILGDWKPGLTAKDQHHGWRQITACLRSYEPKHEHKIAGVGFLIDQWFVSPTHAPDPKAVEAMKEAARTFAPFLSPL